MVWISAVLIGCKPSDPYQKSREIYEQTMNLHDEVMPKMGEVLSLRHTLKMKLDSVTDPAVKVQIDSAMSDLDRTYNGMMAWMANLQPVPDKNTSGAGSISGDKKSPSSDEMVKIQQNSLDGIKALKDQMNKSLKNSKELIMKL